MQNDQLLLGIDLGGTAIKAVLTNPKGEVLDETSTPTHDIPGQDNSKVWKASIKKLIEDFQLKYNDTIICTGISSPGTVQANNRGVLSNGTKLLGIEGFVWKDYIGQDIYVLNDAHAALFAESRLGAGRGYQDILMMTLGTGVGGGIMINGELLQGQKGRAGHIGHISVEQDPLQGIVNTPGSLENAVGQGSLERRSYGRFKDTKTLVDAHLAGDTFATWVWLNSVQALARGMVSFINVLSPAVIIIGGGIAKAEEHLMKPLHDFLDIYEWRPADFKTPIRMAELGNHAGAVGAALFALEKRTKSQA